MNTFDTLILLFLFTITFTTVHSGGEMTLNLLENNPNCLCNDGTPCGYYLRKGSNPDKFVVYLQGGGYCFSEESCSLRWQNSRRLMSSSVWGKTMGSSGILSDDEKVNEHWHDATAVHINYCSSDSFSGTHKAENSSRYNFLGFSIVQEIVGDLKKNYGLSEAKRIVFTGGSAGAEGLLPHADTFPELIPNAITHVLVDSGWFMDYAPLVEQDCKQLGSCTEQRAMQLAFEYYWDPRVNKDCAAAMSSQNQYKCMLGPHAFPFIKTPSFIIQFRFDAAQLGHDGIHSIPKTDDEIQYCTQAARNLTKTFYTQGCYNAVFSASCYKHTVITGDNWIDIKIDGRNIPDVVYEWIYDKPKYPLFYVDTCELANCNPTCPQ